MKTYILRLDAHDDIISARDKMNWGKAERILLVWPERGRVLNRRLDLLLLQRHCKALGAQLAVVSRDREVRYHAPRLGIPVFKSLRKAQGAVWRVPRRFRKGETPPIAQPGTDTRPLNSDIPIPSHATSRLPERPERPKPLPALIRLAAFTIAVLAFLSIAAVLLPQAELGLRPETRTQQATIRVQASPDFQTIDLSGQAPAGWATVIVEGRESVAVSGSISIPDKPAIGHVRFTNLTDRVVEIPEETVVRTLESESIRFIVTQSGSVPGAPGESISLPVRCLTPGMEGNLPANRLVAIEGLLGTQLSVTNPFATNHGSERQAPAPTQEDREQLSAQLQRSLRRTALAELQGNLAEGDLMIPTSLKLVEVLEETFQPADTEPADHLELNMRLGFQALVVPGEEIESLALAVLDANMPAGFTSSGQGAEIENLNRPVYRADALIVWDMGAKRRIQAEIHEPAVLQLALGQTPEQAKANLAAIIPLAAPAQIRLTPEWWPRLPVLPFRILIFNQDIGSPATWQGNP